MFPLDLAAIVQAACTEAIAATQRRRYVKEIEKGGIAKDGNRWLKRAEKSTLKALEARGQAFGSELSADVPMLREKLHRGEGKKWAGSTSMTSWVLFLLAAEGRIVRGRPRGGWTSSQWGWMLADAPLEAFEPEAARSELAARWLAAYGPGTVIDLKWWTGWTLAQTRAALAAVNAEEVDLDGTACFVLPDDAEAASEAGQWVALLPALDSTIMGWKERDFYLGEHGPALFDRVGNAGPTIWSNGRVVGGWSIRPGGEVKWRLLEDVGAESTTAVEAEAGRLEEWLAGKGVVPRFGTPLARELAT